MTDAAPLDPLAGLRLTDHAHRRFTLAEIGLAIGVEPDALRVWLRQSPLSGCLALDPEADEVADTGGRPHRLGWKTTLTLLLAVKLNGFGVRLRGGEAARVAVAIVERLELVHLASYYSPLIAVRFEAGAVRVMHLERSTPIDMVETPLIAHGFAGVGTILLEPIAFGRVLYRLAMDQAKDERAQAEELASDAIAQCVEATVNEVAKMFGLPSAGAITVTPAAAQLTGFATGGPVKPGLYTVGEDGPESEFPRSRIHPRPKARP